MLSNSSADEMTIYDYSKPSIKDGSYTITVETNITFNDSQLPMGFKKDDIKKISQEFKINGPRYIIPREDIHALSPAPLSTGHFEEQLPHIVFNKKSLPWERQFSDFSDNNIPWFILMIFTEDEIIKSDNASSTYTSKGKISSLDNSDSKEEYDCLKVKASTFRKLSPKMNEIQYLNHCRKISSEDEFYSVTVANRLPISSSKDNTKNYAHLISLETYNKNIHAPDDEIINLISLASWYFICQSVRNENFGTLLSKMIPTSESNREEADENKAAELLFRVPIEKMDFDSNNSENNYIKEKLTQGYVPIQYRVRTGDITVAWYRGPFAPLSVSDIENFNNSDLLTSDAFLIYESEGGIFDISYAAAWELGRSIVFSNMHFSQNLISYRTSIHTEVRKNTFKLINRPLPKINTELVSKIQSIFIAEEHSEDKNNNLRRFHSESRYLFGDEPKISSEHIRSSLHANLSAYNADIPAFIKAWFEDLLKFKYIPFNYFVADEKILPAESIRFFQVDFNWMNCLVKGALSVGIHTKNDYLINNIIYKYWEEQKSDDIYCGFFLRSILISSWPTLNIKIENSNVIPIIRNERLSSDTLLVIFKTNNLDLKITIAEPHQQLCFGRENFREMDVFHDQKTYVLDIIKLKENFESSLPIEIKSSSQFSRHLIKHPEKFEFKYTNKIQRYHFFSEKKEENDHIDNKPTPLPNRSIV